MHLVLWPWIIGMPGACRGALRSGYAAARAFSARSAEPARPRDFARHRFIDSYTPVVKRGGERKRYSDAPLFYAPPLATDAFDRSTCGCGPRTESLCGNAATPRMRQEADRSLSGRSQPSLSGPIFTLPTRIDSRRHELCFGLFWRMHAD